MNGDISRIPIQSLAGIISLTDVLPELPLPTPTPSSLSSQSLLYDTRLSEEGYQWLNCKDEWLSHALSLALGSTNTDNIELKEASSHESVDANAVPPLLQAVIALNPTLFQSKRGFKPLCDYIADNNGISAAPQGSSQMACSGNITSGGEDSSPTKKHKKKKKKKKHHKEKKEKKKKHHHHSDDETEADRAYSVVQMDNSPNKISMKISLKPKTEEAVKPSVSPMTEVPKEKKEKKKKKKEKKHKDKDKLKSTSTDLLGTDFKESPDLLGLNDAMPSNFMAFTSNSTNVAPAKNAGSMLRASLESGSFVSPLTSTAANFGAQQAQQSSGDHDSQHSQQAPSRQPPQQQQQQQQQTTQQQTQQQQSNNILSQLLASIDEASSVYQNRQQYPSASNTHNYPPQPHPSQPLIQDQVSGPHMYPPQNAAASQPANVWAAPQLRQPTSNPALTPGNAVASPLSLAGSYPPTPSPVVPSQTLPAQTSQSQQQAPQQTPQQAQQQPQTTQSSQQQPKQQPSQQPLQQKQKQSQQPPQPQPSQQQQPATNSKPSGSELPNAVAPPIANQKNQGLHHSSPASRFDFHQGSPYAPGAYHHRGGPGGSGCKPDIYNSPAGTPKMAPRRPHTPVSKGKPDNYTGHLAAEAEAEEHHSTPKKKTPKAGGESARRRRKDDEETNVESKMPRRRVKRRRNELEELATWHVKDSAYMKPEEAVRAAHDSASVWDNKLGSFTQALGERVKQRKRQARDGVRQTINSFMDEDEEGDANSLSGDPISEYKGGFGEGGPNEKRRKRKDDDEPFEIRLKDSGESKYASQVIKKSNPSSEIRRRERVSCGLGVNISLMTKADLIETGTFKRYVKLVDKILDAVEDVDLKSIKLDDEHFELPLEARVSRQYLSDLCNESAKLKSVGVMSQVPTDRLIRLMTVLLLNVRDGSHISATMPGGERCDDEDEQRLWREVVMDKVMRSIEAGLAALNIMTSADMPKEVYVEDVIEKTIQVAKFQLTNCIYPEYDPAYRVMDKAKETHGSIKSKRARERDNAKPRLISQLYNRLVEVLGSLSQLCDIQQLTDTLVLQLSSMGVSLFFVENVSELQLNGLKLLTSIFSQYEKHRQLIMEDILASLARLPSSKKNLRSYRLNSEDSIQMLTALTLLLIQAVVQLPKPNPHAEAVPPGSTGDAVRSGVESEEPDIEMTIVKSYQTAMRTAHTFLSVFLRKCTLKGEEDYRHVFDNFVNDLLLTVSKPEWPAAEVLLSLLGSLLVQQFSNKQVDQSLRVASLDYLGTVASRLRRDAVNSQLSEKDIDEIIRDLTSETSNGWNNVDESGEYDGDDKDRSTKTEAEEEDNDEDDSDKEVLEIKEEDEKEIKEEDDEESETKNKKKKKKAKAKKGEVSKPKKPKSSKSEDIPRTKHDKIQFLRDAIIGYLMAEQSDPSVLYGRNFYYAQWLSDITQELSRERKKKEEKEAEKEEVIEEEPEELVKETSSRARRAQQRKLNVKKNVPEDVLLVAETKKKKLMDSVKFFTQRSNQSKGIGLSRRRLANFSSMDCEDACLVCRYLASLRPFSQSFDVYLAQILKVLSENSVAVRTKAMKCLTAVVEADPAVLERKDIEVSVHARFLDTSTSVREAAVELVGKFILTRTQLIPQYYPMLAERILDTGISVRKRVIKIFRDICLEQPDFSKIPEMCVKMIRRVNDEEGIKKLVNEVFQNMWFSSVKEKDTVKLLQKVMNITDVVAACKETGYEWFEHLLANLLKKEESEKVRPVEKACKQIVECLVQNIMRLEEISMANSNSRLVACLTTLHLFTKIRPELMVQYAMTLHPYLNIKCNSQSDTMILHYVARILEVTVPLMEHPSESFLIQLETDMVKLTLKYGMMIIESCVSCLGAVVNKVSKNFVLAKDCFQKYFNGLSKFRRELEFIAAQQERNCEKEGSEEKHNPIALSQISQQNKPSILRALFTVGLLCRYFNFDAPEMRSYHGSGLSGCGPGGAKVRDRVFDTLLYFATMVDDHEIRKKALSGLGYLCTRHHELLLGGRLKFYYYEILLGPREEDPDEILNSDLTLVRESVRAMTQSQHDDMRCLVLKNLLMYLQSEEQRMIEADAEWKKQEKQESLKEMGDVASGMGSAVAQAYLDSILESFYHPSVQVRLTAVTVITTILRQGLIHPVKTVPYLIGAQTDCDSAIRIKADQQLQEIDKKYPGFINMRALQGVRSSFRVQQVLQPLQEKARPSGSSNSKTKNALAIALRAGVIRGVREPTDEVPLALNHHLYSMVRPNRAHRRALLNSLLNLFDDTQSQRTPLLELLYIVENLAHFPYHCQEEPLYIIHHIDLIVSVAGSSILQGIRELLYPEHCKAVQQAQQQLLELERAAAAAAAAAAAQAEADAANGEGAPMPIVIPEVPPHLKEQLAARIADFEDDDNIDSLVERAERQNVDVGRFSTLILMSKACVLLLKVKKYLRELHALSDAKIRDYSPSDPAKQWERPLTVRRSVQPFDPTSCVTRELELAASGEEPDYNFLIGEYLSFRQVMMTIDPNEEDEEEIAAAANNPPAATDEAANPQDVQMAMERSLKLRISLTRCDQGGAILPPGQIEPLNVVNVDSDDSVGSAPDQNFVSGTRQRHQRSRGHRASAGRNRYVGRSGSGGGGGGRQRASHRTHGGSRHSRNAKRTSKRRRLQYSSSSDESDDDSFDEEGSEAAQITDDESDEEDW